MLSAEIQQAAIDAANRHGVDPNALLTVLQIEDPSGDPAAVNGNGSSAIGLGQFMPATAAQYGLKDRTDPIASVDAAARYMADNNAALTKALGRPPTVGEQYLAYQQGAGGATQLLTNPDAPASSIIGSKALVANLPKSMQAQAASMTAGQFAGVWADRAHDVASLIPPAEIPDLTDTDVEGHPADALSSVAPPYSVAQLYGQHTQPVPLAPALKNVSGSPDERARIGVSVPDQTRADAAAKSSIALLYDTRSPSSAAARPANASGSPDDRGPLYAVPGNWGTVTPGNIDLNSRPVVLNSDGSVSTVLSTTFTNDDGSAVLVPRVSPTGQVLSNAASLAQYQHTGQNLGVFPDEASADRYADALHQQQAAQYAGAQPTNYNPIEPVQTGGLSPTERDEANRPSALASLYAGSPAHSVAGNPVTHPVEPPPASTSPLVSMYADAPPQGAAPAATWTSPKGDVYRIGDVLHTGGGANGTSNYVITANGPQKLNYTPANTGPTVMSGVVGQAAQQAVSGVQAAIPSAVSGLGSFFGKVFGGGNAAPAAPNSSGSPDDRNSALLATVAGGTATSTVGGKPTAVAATPAVSPLASLFGNIANSIPSPTQASKSVSSGGGPISGGPSLESRTEAGPSLASFYAPNHSGSPDDRQAADGVPDNPSGWGAIYTPSPVPAPSAISMVSPPAAIHGVDVTPTQHTMVVNPAYQAWEAKQQQSPFSNPGVQGLSPDDRDSATGVAGPVPGLSSAVFNTPAPPKYISVAKPAVVRPAVVRPAAPVPVQPKPSVVQLYQSAVPYNAMAAKILATQPNGDPFGNVGGLSTTGYNLMTGGQGGNNASGNRMQSPGGSLTGSQW